MLAIVFFCVLCGIEVKIYTSFTTVFNGVRKIAPEENCPLVRVRVWFRISVRIRAGEGQFSSGAIFLEPLLCYLVMHIHWHKMSCHMSNLRGSIFFEQGELSRFKNKKTQFFKAKFWSLWLAYQTLRVIKV